MTASIADATSRRVRTCVLATAVAMSLAVPGAALAEGGLQSFLAEHGVPGSFWADNDIHTIVSLSTAKRYQVCNILHQGQDGQRGLLEIDADGKQFQVRQGRCSDVEASLVKVRSGTPGARVHGSYRAID